MIGRFFAAIGGLIRWLLWTMPLRVLQTLVRFVSIAAWKTIKWFPVWFVVVYSAAYLGIFQGPRMGRFISARIAESRRGELRIGECRYGYWAGMASVLTNSAVHVEAHDFELVDPDGNTVLKAPLAEGEIHVRELLLALAHFPLSGLKAFSITLHFDHVHIPEAWVVLAPTRSTWGQKNAELNIFAAMGGRHEGPATGGDFRVNVESADIDKLWFGMGFPNARGERSWSGRLDAAEVHARIRYSSRADLVTADGPYLFFALADTKAKHGLLTLGDTDVPLEDLTLTHFGQEEPRRQDVFFGAKAKSLGSSVQIAGVLSDIFATPPGEPGIKMKLDFVDGAGPSKLLPEPVGGWMRGNPRGEVRFAGPLSRVGLYGDISDAGVDVYGVEVDKLKGSLKLVDGRITVEPVIGNSAGGTVRGGVDVALPRLVRQGKKVHESPGWWRVRATTQGVDLARVPAVPAAWRPEIAGTVDGNVKLGGLLGPDADTVNVSGVDLDLVRRRGGRLPQRVHIGGALDWSPRDLDFHEVDVAGEGGELRVDGRISPKRGALHTDITVKSMHGARWLARLGIPDTIDPGDARLDGKLRGTIDKPEIDAHVTAADAAVSDRPIDKLDAHARLHNGDLVVDEIHAETLGATVGGHVNLGLFDGGRIAKLRTAPTIDAELFGTGVAIGPLLAREDVVGVGDVQLRVDGALYDPRGHLDVGVSRLAWHNDPYKNGQLRVDFGNGGATVTALSIERQRGGGLSGHGRIGWDGSLDLKLALSRFPLVAVPSIQALPVAVGGDVSGEVTLAGELTHVLLGGLVSLFGFSVRETAFGDGKLTLEPGADAIAIRGKLFGNVDVDAYLTLFPKFTVTGTLKFVDLNLERIFPEMRKLAELTGRATGECRLTFDGENGLTYAGLNINKLTLTVTGTDETGHAAKEVIRNEEEVLLSTNGKVLKFDRVHLTSAVGDFYMTGQLGGAETAMRMNGRVDLVLLEYFFKSAFDHTHGHATIDLAISGDLNRPTLAGWVDLEKASLEPRGFEHKLLVPFGRAQFTSDGIAIKNLQIGMDGRMLSVEGEVKLASWRPGALRGTVRGELSPRLLEWMFTEYVSEASGRVGVDIAVGGTWQKPDLKGRAELAGLNGKLRSLGYEIKVESGDLLVDGSRFVLGCPSSSPPADCKSLKGKVDDRPASLNGHVDLGPNWALKAVDVYVEGNEWSYNNSKAGLSLAVSPRITLTGTGSRLSASGSVDIVDGRYFQDFDFVDFVLRPRRTAEAPEPPFWHGHPELESLSLDVQVRSAGQLLVKNNIANISMSAQLDIHGTLAEPRIGGSITLDDGGELAPPGFIIRFTTRRGDISFDAGKRIPDDTPTLSVGAQGTGTDTTTDRTFTIDVLLTGTLVHPRLTLSSSEGWDQASILAFLLTGSTSAQVRQRFSGIDPTRTGVGSGTSVSGSTTDNVTHTATGMLLGNSLSTPFKQILGLDDARVAFSSGYVDVNLCKNAGRFFKACGYGQLGFGGTNRVEARVQARYIDGLSSQMRLEYSSGRNVDTNQDSVTRLRFEPFRIDLPISY